MLFKQYIHLLVMLVVLPVLQAQKPYDDFIDSWMLTLPDGRGGWLKVTEEDGYYSANLLWGGGSVLPAEMVVFPDPETMVIMRHRPITSAIRGKLAPSQKLIDVIRATVEGDTLNLTIEEANINGIGIRSSKLTAKRQPPLPPKPDLGKVKYGKPIVLFDGTNIEQWELLERDAISAWKVENGVLVNNAVQKRGQPWIHYANLRTKAEFEDFNLKMDFMVSENGNSGIYLRGIYEVQVLDSYGKPLDSHNMGAVYSRVAPSVAAEKPAGEWQTYDITLVDQHLTVILNGKKIHDNVPLEGCTGGALWSDVTKPGPIYLQGDHSKASYRNIVLTPVLN